MGVVFIITPFVFCVLMNDKSKKIVSKRDKRLIYTIMMLLCSIMLLYFYQISTINNYRYNPYLNEYYTSDYHVINSINPNDTNYSDLAFLKDIVASKKIIILGEQQHGDGSSHLIKIRLIQFLHEHCGFHSLIMETSMFDTFLLAENIESEPDNVDFAVALHPFWGETAESTFLKNHLLSTDNFKIYGMDIQPTGSDSKFRIQKIREIISTVDTSLFDKYSLLFSILSKINILRYKKQADLLPDGQKDSILFQMNEIINDLSSADIPDVRQIQLKQFFSNLRLWLQSKWFLSANRQISLRDSLMAQNFFFLDSINQKIGKNIIWTANSHGIYNDSLLEDNYKRFGNYLKEKYQDSIYVISITSYKGYTGTLYRSNDSLLINESVYQSCEKLMHNLNKDYLFYDFSSKENLKEYSFSLKCLGHNNIDSYWAQMTDGLIFIDNMKPIYYDKH